MSALYHKSRIEKTNNFFLNVTQSLWDLLVLIISFSVKYMFLNINNASQLSDSCTVVYLCKFLASK